MDPEAVVMQEGDITGLGGQGHIDRIINKGRMPSNERKFTNDIVATGLLEEVAKAVSATHVDGLGEQGLLENLIVIIVGIPTLSQEKRIVVPEAGMGLLRESMHWRNVEQCSLAVADDVGKEFKDLRRSGVRGHGRETIKEFLV